MHKFTTEIFIPTVGYNEGHLNFQEMKMKKLISSLAIIGLTFSFGIAAANAKAFNKSINQRQENQQNRIAEGIENGSLNAKEAAHLETRQTHIANSEARMRADGNGLNRVEKLRLEHKLNKSSRHIRAQKHD